jgi:hypothetical protein
VHSPDAHRRRIERRIAASAIAMAVLFAGVVFVWRVVFDDAPWSIPWPPTPVLRGFGAFNLYYWMDWVDAGMVIAVVTSVIVRLVAGRRGATAWIRVGLPGLIFLQTATMYAPLAAMTARRVDRVRGMVEEPAIASRELALSVGVTMVLVAVFVCVTRLRRTPVVVRHAALVVGAILAGILLNLTWLTWVLPLTNQWEPADWQRTDLLRPFRPCRGALLWLVEPRGSDDRMAFPAARIDDIWLHLADPQARDGSVWAVSAIGEHREEYVWLRAADVSRLRVRRDDPALVHCDARPRPELVTASPWHQHWLE